MISAINKALIGLAWAALFFIFSCTPPTPDREPEGDARPSTEEVHVEDPAHWDAPLVQPSPVARPKRIETTSLWSHELIGLFTPSLYGDQQGKATVEMRPNLIGVEVTEPAGIPHQAQLTAPLKWPIQHGDVLVLTVAARRVDAVNAPGGLEFLLEMSGDPYSKYFRCLLAPTPNGLRVQIPFVIPAAYAGAPLRAVLRIGHQNQRVEITELALANFGPIDPARLNLPAIPAYAGVEPDAPWRAAAAQRIQRHRMAMLEVRLLKADGEPLADREVEVELTRHAFPFGAAVSARGLVRDEGPEADIYRGLVTRLFTRVTFENDMKDRFWFEPGRAAMTRDAVDWLRARNIEVRGHCLVWPSWKKSRGLYRELADRPDALSAAIDDYIREMVGGFRGQVVDWDVVNEPHDNHDILDLLGEDAMFRWFNLAHKMDPSAHLYLNDHGLLNGYGVQRHPLARYKETVRALLSKGAPLYGLGQQAHFWSGDFTAPERLLEILDELEELGLPIQITELSLPYEDQALQARYFEDLVTTLFSHPAVNGIILWNFMEGRTHHDSWVLYRRDGTPTPAGAVWEHLLFERWHTKTVVRTDENGIARWEGFYGDYAVRLPGDEGEGVAVLREPVADPVPITVGR